MFAQEAFARRMKEATAGVAKPAAPWLASWRLDRGRRFPRCAVVGGSGGLLGGGAGRRIDAHDAVFRTNDAPTQDKYAADVGTRTHFRVGSHFNWRAHLAQQVARNATGGLNYSKSRLVKVNCQHDQNAEVWDRDNLGKRRSL